MASDVSERLRVLLCRLGDAIRDAVVHGRASKDATALAAVAAQSSADTIYEMDRLTEAAILEWFDNHWPSDQPVEVVMEGIEEAASPCFPQGTHRDLTRWKCILDPIDGTRGIMYDKRSAWALAGLAPQLGEGTSLSDITIAAMTELPTTKQWRADQISCVVGRGLRLEAVNALNGSRAPLELAPSKAHDFRHGFASLAKFFPEGRTLTAQLEEELWDELIGLGSTASPTVFDDQYISTGGQFYELLAGHDRMVGDIRPIVHARLELETSLACHPYDLCVWPVLAEAGVIFEEPRGGFPDAPLDTTTPVAWVGFANSALADLARPVLHRLIERAFA